MIELAHFEWMELKLSVDESDPVAFKPLSPEQLLTGVPVFAPVMQLLRYHWPVQNIGSSFLPDKPLGMANHILGFRDVGDQVQFIALSPITAELLALLGDGLSGQLALDLIDAGIDAILLSRFRPFGTNVLECIKQAPSRPQPDMRCLDVSMTRLA